MVTLVGHPSWRMPQSGEDDAAVAANPALSELPDWALFGSASRELATLVIGHAAGTGA